MKSKKQIKSPAKSKATHKVVAKKTTPKSKRSKFAKPASQPKTKKMSLVAIKPVPQKKISGMKEINLQSKEYMQGNKGHVDHSHKVE